MPSAPCRRACSSARSDSANKTCRQGAPMRPLPKHGAMFLAFLEVQEAQKCRVLGEEVLDLGHACPGPIFQPGLGEVVLDAMKAAFAHNGMIDTLRGRDHGPFGSTSGPIGPG